MNKKALTETDIRTKFITPAIQGEGGAKWELMTQLREEVYFAAGRAKIDGSQIANGSSSSADAGLNGSSVSGQNEPVELPERV